MSNTIILKDLLNSIEYSKARGLQNLDFISKQRSNLDISKLNIQKNPLTKNNVINALLYVDINKRPLFFDIDAVESYLSDYKVISQHKDVTWLTCNFRKKPLFLLKTFTKLYTSPVKDVISRNKKYEVSVDGKNIVNSPYDNIFQVKQERINTEFNYDKYNNELNVSLINEIIVGVFGTNNLRRFIPNFTYVYGGFRKGNFVKEENKNDIIFFNHMDYLNYVVYETVDISVDKVLLNMDYKMFSFMIFQCMLALSFSYKTSLFSHGLLTCENIFVKIIPEYVKINYSECSINTNIIYMFTNFRKSACKILDSQIINANSNNTITKDILTLLISSAKLYYDTNENLYNFCLNYINVISGIIMTIDSIDDIINSDYKTIPNPSIENFYRFLSFLIKDHKAYSAEPIKSYVDNSKEILELCGIDFNYKTFFINNVNDYYMLKTVISSDIIFDYGFLESEFNILIEDIDKLESYFLKILKDKNNIFILNVSKSDLFNNVLFIKIKDMYYIYCHLNTKYYDINNYYDKIEYISTKYSNSNFSLNLHTQKLRLDDIKSGIDKVNEVIEKNSAFLDKMLGNEVLEFQYQWYNNERVSINK